MSYTKPITENAFINWPEDLLVRLLFHSDNDVAREAKAAYDYRHANDKKLAEPFHCSECFEGCPKCQPGLFHK